MITNIWDSFQRPISLNSGTKHNFHCYQFLSKANTFTVTRIEEKEFTSYTVILLHKIYSLVHNKALYLTYHI